jgi:hypothetical protein
MASQPVRSLRYDPERILGLIGPTWRHEASHIGLQASVPTEQLVRSEHPQVAGLADRDALAPLGIKSVFRICGVLFEIGQKLIDFDRFEARMETSSPAVDVDAEAVGRAPVGIDEEAACWRAWCRCR